MFTEKSNQMPFEWIVVKLSLPKRLFSLFFFFAFCEQQIIIFQWSAQIWFVVLNFLSMNVKEFDPVADVSRLGGIRLALFSLQKRRAFNLCYRQMMREIISFVLVPVTFAHIVHSCAAQSCSNCYISILRCGFLPFSLLCILFETTRCLRRLLYNYQ